MKTQLSFNLLRPKLLSGVHFFIFPHYLGIPYCIILLLPSPDSPSLSSKPKWTDVLCLHLHQKAFISKIYNCLRSFKDSKTIKAKAKWEQELGTEISVESEEATTDRVQTTAMCVRLNLIQLKVLHRAHLSKSELSVISPQVPGIYSRYHDTPCNLSSLFFLCLELLDSRNGYLKTISHSFNHSHTIQCYSPLTV